MSRSAALGVRWLLTVACALSLAGCKATPTSNAVAPDELPSYESLAATHNANVNRFDTLWARVIGTVSYVDQDGDRITEQGEGNLQLVKPSRLALSIGKLGEVIAWIGSDDTAYWFLEPTADPRRGLTGSHENFSQLTSERLGLPVSPLAIIDAMGVTPIPTGEPTRAVYDESLHAAVYEIPSRHRRYAFDLTTRSLVRIEFLGADGAPLATATLSDEEQVRLLDESGYFPRIAKRVEIEDPATGSSFRITLSECVEKPIKPRVFDLAQLRDAFLIEDLTDLDR